MSRALEDYRAIQIDLRLLTQALGALNDAEKVHPEKAHPTDKLAKQAAWHKIKAGYNKRRESLKQQLNDKQERRDMLYLNLLQTPLPMVSMADVIDKLTEVETVFATDGANDAWDKLSSFIDQLDMDEARVNKLKAVKAA